MFVLFVNLSCPEIPRSCHKTRFKMSDGKPEALSSASTSTSDAHGPLYSGYHNIYKKHSVHQVEVRDINQPRRFSLRPNQSTERRASRCERRPSECSIQNFSDAAHVIDMKRDSVSSMVSTTSTVTILPNPYNRFNHHIHAVAISPCCMVFFLICCLPAVRTMNKSDTCYQEGDDSRAKVFARRATFLFFFGMFLTLLTGGVILFLVVYFTTRKN